MILRPRSLATRKVTAATTTSIYAYIPIYSLRQFLFTLLSIATWLNSISDPVVSLVCYTIQCRGLDGIYTALYKYGVPSAS